MPRRVFFVTSGRLAIYHWDGGRLDDPLLFVADEDGLAQLSVYLRRFPSDPVYMLVDFVEEEFREETIPHVMGADRRALIRTKLNRLFRDATYGQALLQGREEDGRRDDRMLFMALTRPDLLAPWIGQLTKHKVPLAGIYSLPALTRGLLKHLGVDAGHALVVTMQSAGGLRQTFFDGKQLKLSRLAVMPNMDPRGHASYVLGEIEKIRRYLNSLRMLPHDTPLEVYVVAGRDQLDDITRQSPDSVTTRHHPVELEEISAKTGVKDRYRSPYADRLFAHLLAAKPPAQHYAPASVTRYHTLHESRRWIKVASVALLIGSLTWAGWGSIDAVVASRDTDTLRRQTVFYEDRYSIARERLPATPADSRDMKLAVDMVGTLAEHRPDPLDMMRLVSLGLRDFPTLQVEQIDWRSSADPEAPVTGTRRKASGVAALLGAVPTAPTAERLYQLASVKGRIDPFAGDYREALELVSRFADRLRAQPNVNDVQVVSLPLDIGSEARLSGDASVEAVAGSAPFELRIVLQEEAPDETG